MRGPDDNLQGTVWYTWGRSSDRALPYTLGIGDGSGVWELAL